MARRTSCAAILITLLCAGLALWTSARLTARDLHGRRAGELMYFPSGILLKPMAVGHPLTLADLLWLRAIQYYGEHRLSDNRFPFAGHIFDTITTLDPHFVEAYLFGGMVLVDEGRDIERGIALLRRGMAWNPHRWELAFETGFAYYIAARDDAQAARFFAQAAGMEGAPDYVMRFAAYVRGRAGDPWRALVLWEELERTTRSATIRALAQRKAAEIRAALREPAPPRPPKSTD